MNWTEFTPITSLTGGVLIGFATGLALLLNGKIAGISGVVGRILRSTPGDALWRVWFVGGLVAGGGLTFALYPPSANLDFSRTSVSWMAVAGLLVGIGTRLGGGCTSGHGVCWYLSRVYGRRHGNGRVHDRRWARRLHSLSADGRRIMKGDAALFVPGLLFGTGLAISGMSNLLRSLGSSMSQVVPGTRAWRSS